MSNVRLPDVKKPRVTLATLAEDLGVSRATVSNAYNRPDQLSADLRDRILARAEVLGFAGPDPAARSLRRGRVGAVGVLLDEGVSYAFSDPAAVLLFDGLAQELEHDQQALLLLAGRAPRGPDPAAVREAVVDAWVIASLSSDSPAIAAARARQQPMVALDQPILPGVPVVALDDAGGTRAAMEHAIGLGHRRIGVVSFAIVDDDLYGLADLDRQAATTYAVTARRLAGAAAAVKEAGMQWAGIPVVESPHNNPECAAEAAALLLSRRPRPTAIVTFSDQLALGVLYAARAAGLSVPAQLSVVGFDDTPAAALADPPLTTVRQPLGERGRAVGRLVRELLAGEQPTIPPPYPTELIVRGSTAPPRANRQRR
jgi:DNA-binding LacI/PurR family transcriptional regulator